MDNIVRDNEIWVTHLSRPGTEQQQALHDLRAALLRGLSHALSGRQSIDESFIEDTVQDALLLILEKLEQFEGRSKFLTWATSIAIHVAMSKLRRKQWKDISLDKLIADNKFSLENASEKSSGPDKELERDSILNMMQKLINNDLTEKQRHVLLAELRGMPQDEIARFMGSNRNAIYKLAHDARKRLKNGLEAAGYDAGDINTAFTA